MSDPTPHRFVEATDGNPIPVAELEMQAREARPGYWVTVTRANMLDYDAQNYDDDRPFEFRSATHRFDTQAEAGAYAASQLDVACAVFVFWGWRLPLMSHPMSISLSGGGRPFETCHELADGQIEHAGLAVVEADNDEDSESTEEQQ